MVKIKKCNDCLHLKKDRRKINIIWKEKIIALGEMEPRLPRFRTKPHFDKYYLSILILSSFQPPRKQQAKRKTQITNARESANDKSESGEVLRIVNLYGLLNALDNLEDKTVDVAPCFDNLQFLYKFLSASGWCSYFRYRILYTLFFFTQLFFLIVTKKKQKEKRKETRDSGELDRVWKILQRFNWKVLEWCHYLNENTEYLQQHAFMHQMQHINAFEMQMQKIQEQILHELDLHLQPSVCHFSVARQFGTSVFDPQRQMFIVFGGFGASQLLQINHALGYIPLTQTEEVHAQNMHKPVSDYSNKKYWDKGKAQKSLSRNRLNDTLWIDSTFVCLPQQSTPSVYDTLVEDKRSHSTFIKPRMHHTSALFGDVMFVFGGRGNPNQPMNDAWCLDLKTKQWYNVTPSNDTMLYSQWPSCRYRHGMCIITANISMDTDHVDSISNQIVIFGGIGGAGVLLNDCYLLEFIQPKQTIDPTTVCHDCINSITHSSVQVLRSECISDHFTGRIPSARCSFAMDYVPSMHAILLFGGLETLDCGQIPTFDHNIYVLDVRRRKWNTLPTNGGLMVKYDDINSFTITYNDSVWLFNVNTRTWSAYKWSNEVMRDYMLIGHSIHVFTTESNDNDSHYDIPNKHHTILRLVVTSGGITVLFYGQVHVPVFTCSITLPE
ncbi:hypothetical protein RFI_32659 [Reticulomyxa filosa]|uniref:Kelch motif family protein n=1 Tax=Reticulomyxa filosa TaxID=46433 RepID=X6LSV9_RETFI|nr:hypothetical protein RFI_32659 [Reticulomyxa filosa]|eukprot:ETO04734.1 hypothetical protein RFI_32659 [Reticulomyxa filosa]